MRGGVRAFVALGAAIGLAFGAGAATPSGATGGAGPWTYEAGGTYVRESIFFYGATRHYDEDGAVQPGDWSYATTSFRNTQFLHVGEYGLREGLALVTGLVYKDIRADRGPDAPSQGIAGFGDLTLGLKQRIVNRGVVLSGVATVDIPTGYRKITHATANDFYALGTGETEVEFRLLAGGLWQAGPIGGSYGVEGGYRLRGGPYANDVVYAAGASVEPMARLRLRAGAVGVENLHRKGNPLPAGPVYLSGSIISATTAAGFAIRPNSVLEIGYTRDLRGKNAFKGQAIEIAIEYRR